MYHPTEKTSEMCLQFYYFMGGTGSVELDVKIVRGFENSKEPETSLTLWKLQTGNTKRKEWLGATVKLNEYLTETSFKVGHCILNDGSKKYTLKDLNKYIGCRFAQKLITEVIGFGSLSN